MRNLNRYGTRIAVVLASLVVAFSLVLAVSIMIASFRTTVGGWVERLFQADFYVKTAPEGLEQAGPDLDPEFARQVRQIPGVQAATPLLRYHTVTPEGDRLTLRGIETGVWRNHSPFRFLRVTRDAWQRFRRDGVFLSEPGSYRMDKHLGDTLLLPVPGGGLRASPIVGVFNDYTTFWALVYLDYTRMRELYPSARIQDLAIFVGEGVDPGNVEPRVRRLVDERRYILRANHQLRAIALDNFDRTFAVTHMMQLIASVIAVVGLMVLLMAFNRTRRRLFGLLVATGTSRGQVVRLVLEEAGLLSLMALAGSIPTGLGLGYLLIHVVNRRSFGWLIEFDVGGYVFLQLLMLVAGSFVLGLLFPVYDIYRRSLPSLLREEEA